MRVEIFIRLTNDDADQFRRLFQIASAEVPPGAWQTKHSFAKWLIKCGMNVIDPINSWPCKPSRGARKKR